MTKSDNFFDISGSSTPPKTAAGGTPIEVDFNVFGNETPAAAADATDFTETAVMPNSPLSEAADSDLNDDLPSRSTTPVPLARTAPVTIAPELAPAPGGGTLWIAIAAAIVLAVVVWWVMR